MVNGNLVCPGIDDAANFKIVKQALTTFGFSSKDQDSIFRLLSGILRLGNIQFAGTDQV